MLARSCTILFLAALNLPVNSQVICVNCYDQNEPIDVGGVNLISNGSFENTTCGTWPNFWDVYCPSSANYVCDIQDWVCTGGGTATYTLIFDAGTTTVPDGLLAAYMGNAFAEMCSPMVDDTSCLVMDDCLVTGIPAGFPVNEVLEYGGTTGVSISQTISGLTVGTAYVLEFWAGGEAFPLPGVFGVDVGFGNMFLRCKPTVPGAIGTRYTIEFLANNTSHTIKFTNWGHISSSHAEVILDDIRLKTSTTVPLTAQFTVAPIGGGCGMTVLTDNQSIQPGNSYLWDMGDGATYTTPNVTHTYGLAGTYTITLIVVGTDCAGSDTTTQVITVAPPAPVEALFTAVVMDPCTGLGVITDNASNGPSGLVYTWSMGDGTLLGGEDVTHMYQEIGTYSIILTATDTACNVSDTYQAEVTLEAAPNIAEALKVPNVFSPNGDGLNDVFFPIEDAGSYVTLRVWDRWGVMMFETPGQYKPWNGRTQGNKPVPEGVYFYEMVYDVPCGGTTISGKTDGYVHVVGTTM